MRCDSTMAATARMSSPVTAVRPSRAALALAAFSIVMSARWPSTPKWVVTLTTASSTASDTDTSGRRDLAPEIRDLSASVSSLTDSVYPSGSESKASLRRTTSMRMAVSLSPCTSTDRPNLSRSCGRRSPSSGFMVPTSTNLEGCEKDTPSLST